MRQAIVYLHGFRSSPQSVKANQVAAAVAALPDRIRPRLFVPALEVGPATAIASISAWIAAKIERPSESLTIVGSSLGGFYATHLAERTGARAVLVNPSIRPQDDLKRYLGVQTNLYTGEPFVVTEAHFAELASLAVARITRPERYWLLVQAGDEVLDYREAVRFYAGAWQLVEGGGDHTFQRFDAQIPAILRFARIAAPA